MSRVNQLSGQHGPHPRQAADEGRVRVAVEQFPQLPFQANQPLPHSVLRHLHGYTNREIASALGIPESTVASRLMEAKRALRARLPTYRHPADASDELRTPCDS